MAETKASWVTTKPEEVKKIIVELAKQNIPPAKIGLVLRDQHGIPKAKLLGLKIGKVLKEHNLHKDTENEQREKKIEVTKKHFEKNKHDYKAQRVVMRLTTHQNFLKKKR